jgi:hypothetical protein
MEVELEREGIVGHGRSGRSGGLEDKHGLMVMVIVIAFGDVRFCL